MNLLPGYRLAVAPHFHLPADWPRRVRIGAGVEEADGRMVPRTPWRAPTADELGLLTQDPPSVSEESRDECLCLFQLPEHLHSAWWDLLEQAGEWTSGRLEGLDGFVAEVAELLAFKYLPVPPGAAFDLVLSPPGQRSIRPEGLAFDLDPEAPWPETARAGPRLWGGINLGEEAIAVTLINLPALKIQEVLTKGVKVGQPPRTHGDLARRFLTARPNYPVVRVSIEPGEGYRLPRGGLLWDSSTSDQQGPGVLLVIRDASSGQP